MDDDGAAVFDETSADTAGEQQMLIKPDVKLESDLQAAPALQPHPSTTSPALQPHPSRTSLGQKNAAIRPTPGPPPGLPPSFNQRPQPSYQPTQQPAQQPTQQPGSKRPIAQVS